MLALFLAREPIKRAVGRMLSDEEAGIEPVEAELDAEVCGRSEVMAASTDQETPAEAGAPQPRGRGESGGARAHHVRL